MIRLFFHLYIAFSYRVRHSALTHILPNHGIAFVNKLFDIVKDICEILFTATESGCPKQKDFSVFQLRQQFCCSFVRISLSVQNPIYNVSEAGTSPSTAPKRSQFSCGSASWIASASFLVFPVLLLNIIEYLSLFISQRTFHYFLLYLL